MYIYFDHGFNSYLGYGINRDNVTCSSGNSDGSVRPGGFSNGQSFWVKGCKVGSITGGIYVSNSASSDKVGGDFTIKVRPAPTCYTYGDADSYGNGDFYGDFYVYSFGLDFT